MSELNKKLTAILVSMVVVLVIVIVLTAQVLRGGNSAPSVQPPNAGSAFNAVTTDYAVNQYLNQNINQGANQNEATNNIQGENQNAGTQQANPNVQQQPAAQTTAPAVIDPSAMSNQQMLDMITAAVNKTKAYNGNLSATHSESFTANVTECTGGSLIAGIATRLIGMVVKPTDENLNFSGGTAVNSEGEQVTILLPQKGLFRLTMSGIKSISASQQGNNTVISITLIPESVGMYDVPAANAAGVGFLDVASLDLSLIEVTSADIVYQGSTIKAVINPQGYVTHAEYTIPLHVVGAAKVGFVSGSATFDGMQTEIWDLNL